MANINKLSWSFVDNVTTIYAEHMNGIVNTINNIIDALDENSGSGSTTPEPTPTTYTITVAASPVAGGTVTGSGSYVSGQSATLTATAASGYSFQSWNDGNTNSTRAITVNSNQTYTATFVSIAPTTVATPVITVNDGVVTITCATSDAAIHYTTDGSTPTAGSTTYSAAFTPESSVTQIKAIAIKSGMTNSSVASQAYTPASIPVQAETTAILSRYTKTVSQAHQNALNTFVYALKNAGVYNKINYLSLPFLATDVSEAMQDALGSGMTVSNTSSILLQNNTISPIVGEPIAIVNSTSIINTDAHVSFYSVDAATVPTGKWDVGMSRKKLSIGKKIDSKIGMQYNADVRWQPSEVESFMSLAGTHVIGIGSTSGIAMSVNGTYVADTNAEIQAGSTNTTQLFQNVSTNSNTYSDGTTTTGAYNSSSVYKYGLLSIGNALSQTEAIAFNNAVTALMNVIFA